MLVFRFCQKSFLILFLLVLTASCTKSSFKSLATPQQFSNVKHENTLSDTTQSYELYLPLNYSKSESYPVILLFDAHKDGKLAVEKFKESAEIFGYILVASNNAGNGVQNTNEIAEKLLQDVSVKYRIDRKRIYAAGFSGGARIALAYAIKSEKVRGVIECSAGIASFDPVYLVPKMDLYGIAGFDDFNYKEIADIPRVLASSKWRNAIDVFDGGHTWPPSAYIKKAVLWFQLNEMKDKIIGKNKKMIEEASDTFMLDIDKALQQKRYLLAGQKAQSAISLLSSLKDTKVFEEKLNSIQSMPEYQAELDKAVHLKYEESQMQNELITNFSVKDTVWWKNEIDSLVHNSISDPDIMVRQMFSRMKGFLGILCYSYASGALENNDLISAGKYIAVYQIAEPTNPDAYFYKGVLLDKQGKPEAAVESLKKAISFGFSDRQKIDAMLSDKVKANLN